ncbi:zinc finger protein [Macleaya cordata]|uniref:RING-type E3 ubiquitin transferase n=1 Tax=Macleaya cordata TaxID=56857 RepID=A0A200R9W7_MACCD|nr:zinc finger protein [Macleaya cordata]
MKFHNRKLLLDDEDAPSGSTTSTTLQSSDPLLSTNTSTTSTTKPFKPTLGFDSSMALTVLVLLTALFFMVFFSMYLRRFAGDSSTMEISRRRRQQRRNNSSSPSPTSSFSSSRKGLDPSTVKSLPLFAYEIGNSKESSLDCVVCLSEFEEKETVKMIPYCGHVFHQECIDMWFSSHVSCPLCRSTQLFLSNSITAIKKIDGSLDHHRKRFDEDDQVVVVMMNDHQVGSVVGSSTVESGDTCVEREIEEAAASSSISRPSSVRRSRSWSRLFLGREKVLLRRSLSF